MNSVKGSSSIAASARFWHVAVLTAAGAIGTTRHAEAAFYYWTDYSDGSYFARQERRPELLRQKPQKRSATGKKDIVAEKEVGAKPQGPLVIVVSIDRQKVTIYDSNGVFAESPVSTGMKGHSTPMGVFSVIQKHKFHHSNIYSNAPMPYMQRITWSGVAMHAGVLPGYPASHGCIRMPTPFAVKMWNWTKMGARVIVTPGQMTPRSFSHPLLASVRVAPQPAASLEPQTNAGDKADRDATETKTAEATVGEAKPAETKTANAHAVLELRSTVGHAVMSDLPIGDAPAHDEAVASADRTVATETKTAEVSEPAEVANAAAKPDLVAADASKDAPKATATTDAKPAEKVGATKTETAESSKTLDAAVTATAPAQSGSPDVSKDQGRLADPAPSAKVEAPKRAGQIAVFISRKDPSSMCGRTLRRCSRYP